MPSNRFSSLPCDADVERVRVRRGVNDAQPRLPLGQRSQIGSGDRQLQVVAAARDQDLVGLAGIEVETRVDDRLFDRSAGGGDANASSRRRWAR